MLRQRDIIKFNTKSKADHILFLRKDAEYTLKNNRPIKDNLIQSLNEIKVHQFIEDILTNKKISKLLFAKNSKFEIKTYLNIKKKFFTHKNSKTKIKDDEDNITTKMIKKETYIKMKNEINSYKKEKQKTKNSMDRINNKKAKKFKNELNIMQNGYNKAIIKNRIKGFIRAYSTIKYKFDNNRNKKSNNNSIIRNNSCILHNNYSRPNMGSKTTKNRKNKSIKKSISSETNETEARIRYYSNSLIFNNNNNNFENLNLPNVKLNIKDVFNRLYHNVVLLSPSGTTKNKKRPLSCKNFAPYSATNSDNNNKKIKFNLKKVIKSTSGKEFTFKITKDIIQRCFIKYSGGPTVLKMNHYNTIDENEKNEINNRYNNNKKKTIDINQELEEEIGKTKNNDDLVNFYKLIDKKTGNSFLHLAVIGGYDQFVKYFIEKKADINMKNFDGNTPLHLALINKDKKIIDILMKNNPKLDIPNNKGEIPFELFTDEMKEHYGIDKLLIVNENKK